MEDRRGRLPRQPSYGTNTFNDLPNQALSGIESGHSGRGLVAHPSTYPHPSYDHDVEVLMDAFDKELLAQIPQERQQQASQGLARVSLPPRYGPYDGSHLQHRAVREDLYEAPAMGESSPSRFGPPSSPTVAALQNRRVQPNVRGMPYRSLVEPTLPTAERPDLNSLVDEPTSPRPPRAERPPVIRGIQLICADELPDKIRSIFPYELLNAVQSKCFHTAFHTDDNLVLSAPTGSGKTLVLELAIARLLATGYNTDFKVVYMAPTKALCAERQQDWQRKFGLHGLDCAKLTGDTDYQHLRKVQQANIIITTPEKWDSVTRKWRDNAKLVQLIKLFLVDEVHILKDSRGATLEAVVSRMKSIGTAMRFIALSATVPNSEDIAAWLGKDSVSPQLPAQREVFDESFRPVKLDKHVYGFQGGSNDFQFDVKLRNQVPDAILRHSKGKPTMVFCITRKSAAQTAHVLANMWGQSPGSQKLWTAPARPVAVKDAELRTLVVAGVAFHHAGLLPEDRQVIEQGFVSGSINVICSTSTLAVGVNLPCYMVILQGTVTYGDAGPEEYSDLEIMQMLGRAGRPQYERSACAAILTREDKVVRYQNILSGHDLLESTLHRNLIEHLNAEIGLGTIFNFESAKKWLASTFLRVRLLKNPAHYQLKEGVGANDESEILQQICEKDISLLTDADLVEEDNHLRCTELGDAMARYYVKFDTMKTFAATPPKAKMSEILSILAQAAEFLEVRVRAGEKPFYKELNKANEIRFPIKVDVALSSHKVSLILQAHLGSVREPAGPLHDKHHAQYHTDTLAVFTHANRLIRCIIDCQLSLKDAVSAKNALELARSLSARAWDNTPNVLKQVQGIGDVYMRKLAAKGINSIDTLLTTDPQRINLILGKPQPFGSNLQKKVASFPNLMVAVKEMDRKIRNGKGVTLKLNCEVGFLNEQTPYQFGRTQVYVCFLLEDSNGSILDFRRFGARKLEKGEVILLSVELTKPTAFLRSHVMCDGIAGTSRYAEIQLRDIPTTIFPQPAETAKDRDAEPTLLPITEAFNDEGVADDELLAASNMDNDIEDGIEVVQDIDDLMEEENAAAGAKRKRRSSYRPSFDDDDGDQVEFRESVQLDNGRWTCQHLCKEKGIECKHKCCKEGVLRPRRRPRKPAKTEDSGEKQQKLTAMANVTKKSSTAAASGSKSLHKLRDATLSFSLARPGISEEPSRISAKTSKKRKLSSNTDLDGYDEINADIEIDGPWGADDTDWCLPPSFQADKDTVQNHPVDPAEDFIAQASEDLHLGLGAEPHAGHVTAADVERKLDKPFFVTGESSSPIKPKQVLSNQYTMISSDTFGTPFDVADFLDDENPNMDYADAHESSSMSPQDGPRSSSHAVKPTGKDTNVNAETEQETEKRLFAEDQKRKWDQFEPWMFEEFGSFAEIV